MLDFDEFKRFRRIVFQLGQITEGKKSKKKKKETELGIKAIYAKTNEDLAKFNRVEIISGIF